MGGELKQYQVLTSPERLAEHDVTIDELTLAVQKHDFAVFLAHLNHLTTLPVGV